MSVEYGEFLKDLKMGAISVREADLMVMLRIGPIGLIPVEIPLDEILDEAKRRGMKVNQDSDNHASYLRRGAEIMLVSSPVFDHFLQVGENPLDDSDPSAYVPASSINPFRLFMRGLKYADYRK